jgi:hypothetical protein
MSRFIVIALVLASIASLATAQNCSVGSADYFVPRLANQTQLSGGSLYYVIEYNKAAFSAVGSFDGSTGSCSFVQNNVIASSGCVNSHQVNMSITASQFTGCGFTAASSSSSATYTGRYKLTTVEQAGVLRNIVFNRTVESAILFQVSFATTVNATSGNVSVYGAAITEAVITSQLFDTTSYVASLQITTSVQFPYVLTGLSAVGTTLQNSNTLSAASSSNGNCSSALTAACFQVFNLTLTPTNPCVSGGASNLNNAAGSVWSLNFTVSCDSSRINCTGTPTPGSVLITFTTASPNYCPQVLGTITPTMTLTAYDGGNLIPQTFFVWGTQSYFRAVLSSPVDVEKIALTKVNLPTGGVTGLADLYSRTYDSASAAAFWSADIASAAATIPVAGSCAMVSRSENNRTDPYVYFTINWSSSISAATGDNPLDTTVYVEARIKYAGSSGSAERVIRQKMDTLSATPSSMGARAQVGVIQAESTPVSTAARSSSSSNMAIIAVASVGGAIAVLSVFAVVAIKKRRNSKEQQERMESVYLSRLETPASTA